VRRGAVGCYGARGSFYRAGGREGRRCGEGNDRRRGCAFKAFNPSVLGGERRGEWGVKGGGGMRCCFWERRGRRGGARSGFQRKKTAGLTDRVGPPGSEGEATGMQGQKGREEVGRGWAGKEGMKPGQNHCSG
jgi:hypothetical protein